MRGGRRQREAQACDVIIFLFRLLCEIFGWPYLEGPALGRGGNGHQGTHVLARVLEAVLARDG